MIIHGDCLEKLKEIEDNSVDSIVTDPPYGLSFMGKKWDYDVPSVEIWKECLRVLKPGGHALIACGTRTQHRMAVNIEDAGFEIRDVITWLYGSGFPKSTNIGKRIDVESGAACPQSKGFNTAGGKENFEAQNKSFRSDYGYVHEYKTDLAKKWQGFGTALKPACEFWTLARKPIEGTVASNVTKWGVGGINVDGCRVRVSDLDPNHRKPSVDWQSANDPSVTNFGSGGRPIENLNSQGRFPANLILDEEAAALLDEQSGTLKSGALNPGHKRGSGVTSYDGGGGVIQKPYGNDSGGGASRFFYVAKASKSERNAGCEDFEPKQKQGARPNSADDTGKFPDHDHRESGGNNHPTVKPIKLMRYLCRLITPPRGTVLDPFMGSGSTGLAAKQEGFSFIGIEREAEYVKIAEARLGAA